LLKGGCSLRGREELDKGAAAVEEEAEEEEKAEDEGEATHFFYQFTTSGRNLTVSRKGLGFRV